MMALLNPSFEDAGALPGEAEHWTLTASTSLEVLAGFGPAPEEAWEGFERWFSFLASIDDVVVVLAFFDSALKGYEEFDAGWANAVYLYELPPAQLVTCAFGGGAVEDCETGWSNVPYEREWADVTSATGVFDGNPREDFALRSYLWTWSSVVADVALFDRASESAEMFDGAWTNAGTQ